MSGAHSNLTTITRRHPPHLKAIPDPMDGDGNVILPQTPGLGAEYNWAYIDENRVDR